MNKYIELKLKKAHLIIIVIIIIAIGSFIGYYHWCSNNPNIKISINYGATNKESTKMEAPHIVITKNSIAEPSAKVQLYVGNIITQHELLCDYINKTYKSADIKLDIESNDNKLILKYHGTVVDSENKTIEYKNDIDCDFTYDAKIEHK
ncbi:MAG: hypothetical protein RR646_02650 [Erysipelotrichaceae bacterium]